MKIFNTFCKIMIVVSTLTILYGLYIISTMEEVNEDYIIDAQQDGYIIKNNEKPKGVYIPFGELEEFIINDNL